MGTASSPTAEQSDTSSDSSEQLGSPSSSTYTPPSGYCYSSEQVVSSQCYNQASGNSCQKTPGCTWSQSCMPQQCNPGDDWCLSTMAASAVCKPLVCNFFGGGTPLTPAPQLCTTFGACTAATNDTSGACASCMDSMGQVFSYWSYLAAHPQSDDTVASALQQCLNTVGQLMDTVMLCGNIAGTIPPSFASAAAECSTFSSLMCDNQTDWNGYNVTTYMNCSSCTGYLSIWQVGTAAGGCCSCLAGGRSWVAAGCSAGGQTVALPWQYASGPQFEDVGVGG